MIGSSLATRSHKQVAAVDGNLSWERVADCMDSWDDGLVAVRVSNSPLCQTEVDQALLSLRESERIPPKALGTPPRRWQYLRRAIVVLSGRKKSVGRSCGLWYANT